MGVPNLFNKTGSGTSPITILDAFPELGHKIAQLNIQNRNGSTDTIIEILAGDTVIIGPLVIGPEVLLSLDLSSEVFSSEAFLRLPKNTALKVQQSANVDLTIFGFAEQY